MLNDPVNDETSTTSQLLTTTPTATFPPDNIIFDPNLDYNTEGPDSLEHRDSTKFDTATNGSSIANISTLEKESFLNSADVDDEGFSYRGLKITRVVYGPCLFLMFVCSALLAYIILKHLRSLIYLYVSVLFYASTQVLLLLVIVVSWSLSGIPDTTHSCQIKVTIHSLSLVLPGYGLLFITLVRTIFVRRPFDNDLLLKVRYQLAGLFLTLCLCGAVYLLPHVGVCGIDIIESPASGFRYCGYKYGTGDCLAFTTAAVAVGYALPIVSVLALYMVIYATVIIARRNSRKLSYSVALSTTSDEAEGNTASKGNYHDWAEKLRTKVPWCIIVLLFLYMISTVPWIPMDLYSHRVVAIFERGSYSNLAFDMMYSILLIGSGVSPLTYLVSSNTLRGLLFIEFRRFKRWICCNG